MKYWVGKISLYLGISAFFLFLQGSVFSFVSAGDLMQQAFQEARNHEAVIDIGSTKEAVGNEILRESQTVDLTLSLKKKCYINEKVVEGADENDCRLQGGDRKGTTLDLNAREPLIVRIAKFILRITMVLAITMVIINAVYYMIEVIGGKDFTSAEAKKNLFLIAGGIVLALSSVGIINLIGSVTKSSLTTTEDLGDVKVGCSTGGVIIAGDDLKKWICENSMDGKWYADRAPTLNRCREGAKSRGFDAGEWSAITAKTMREECVQKLGGTSIN